MSLLLIGAYLGCAVLTYGITLAYFQRGFPRIAKENCREDMGMAVMFATLGPLALFVVLCTSGFAKHGLMFRCDCEKEGAPTR